ncbi:hypothetical protein [uncultured Parolsenella sp.]|uniref:hypothetical protein n=1 Tax=uncultured Parolsenella sp. TaxID=2083008 RepID=UPI0025E91112|nr:hypothetical protein [uncultured Parolsenella sp.]
MGVCVLVLGQSGSGKSTSLRNFEPDEVGVLNVIGKPLPFRKHLNRIDHADYRAAMSMISSGRLRAWVVDDAGYLMANENFARAKEGGYGKFTDMAVNFQRLVQAATRADADTITYLLMHVELDANGHEKVKTIGRMLDEKYCIEGACPIVIDCVVRDGRHVFVTENDGTNLAKAPMGMLPPEMDNDLKAVDAAIREYWGMAPLMDERLAAQIEQRKAARAAAGHDEQE